MRGKEYKTPTCSIDAVLSASQLNTEGSAASVMSSPSSKFRITEHISPAQHLREFPFALRTHERAALQLAVKEYRPVRDAEPDERATAVTLVATHANGFPKECYEALWEELVAACAGQGVTVRSIWMADCSHQGASYALNEAHLGDDPGWFDHSRDLLAMVNHFRDQMVPPLVGIGHSMGAAQLVHLSQLHPRLLYGVALIEPVIVSSAPAGPNAASFTSRRRERWPTRAAAEASFHRNPFFAAFDARVLQAYLAHGLRHDPSHGGVMLATPKAQESWSYVRANFEPLPATSSPETRARERLLSPDYLPFSAPALGVFTRPECLVADEALPSLRPHTLFLYGADSHMNTADGRAARLAATGTARGGSGGLTDGAVEEHVVDEAGHLVCFEKPRDVALPLAAWLAAQVQRWRDEAAMWAGWQSGKSVPVAQDEPTGTRTVSEKWLRGVDMDAMILRRSDSGEDVARGKSKL